MRKTPVFSGVIFPVAISIVPGWGHIWVRRGTRGLVLFLLFFSGANFAVVRTLQAGGDTEGPYIPIAIALCAGVVVFTFIDILRITLWARSSTVQARRTSQFRRVLVHYLRSEYGQAEENVNRMLRIDPYDTTALMYSAMIKAATGDRSRAAALYKKVLRVDSERKWTHEVKRELAALG